MGEDGRGVAFDIVGDDKVAARQRGIGARHFEESQRPARAGSHRHAPVDARGMDERGDITFKIGVHMNRLDRFAQFQHLFGFRDFAQLNFILFSFAAAA